MKVSGDGASAIGAIPSGGIVEVWVLAGASPQAVADAVRSLWLTAIRQGLRPLTVAQIDGSAAVGAGGSSPVGLWQPAITG